MSGIQNCDGNDFLDHANLFDEAFNNYHNYTLLNKGEISVIGENYYKKNKLYIKNKITYPLTLDEENILKLKFEIDKKRKYKNNDKVGMVKVYLGDSIIKREGIYVKVK